MALQIVLNANSNDDTEVGQLNYSVGLLDSIAGIASLSDHELFNKTGCVVMLHPNLQPRNGHLNGSR